MVGSGDDQTANGQCEHTHGCLGNCYVEILLYARDTAEEKAHAHHQEQVGQNTSDERGLHDEGFALDQCDDCDDQFDGVTIWVRNVAVEGDNGKCEDIPERGIQQTTDRLTRARRYISIVQKKVRYIEAYRIATSSVAKLSMAASGLVDVR